MVVSKVKSKSTPSQTTAQINAAIPVNNTHVNTQPSIIDQVASYDNDNGDG